jgi:hypothetical protein
MNTIISYQVNIIVRRTEMTGIQRSFNERRSGKERRRKISVGRLFYRGPEKRSTKDRRLPEERRNGWVRVSKWSSVPLWDLKIAKFLK